MRSPEVVFFGSGPVAAKALELLAKNFCVEAVVTKQKPAHHHGDFPVITVADSLKLKTLYAGTKAELSELFKSKPVKSRLGIVIDYGVIISQDVIDYFPFGILNSHFSLLPEWRGADPISFSILSGQGSTGVSIMLIVPALDEGPLIALGEQLIDPTDTTATLTEKLILLSDTLLKDALPKYLSGESKAVPQERVAELLGRPFTPSHSRKLTKQDGQIDWDKPAEQIEREIRAYSEWPRSHTSLDKLEVVLTEATVTDQHGQPGKYKVEGKTLVIFASPGALKIEKLKPIGKNEMSAESFINGYRQLL